MDRSLDDNLRVPDERTNIRDNQPLERDAREAPRAYQIAHVRELIDSVSEVGASYFDRVIRDHGLSWLAVVPLADAVTLPACPMPRNVIFVDAFHGGLLGDPSVRRIVAVFLAGGTPSDQDLDAMAGGSQRDLRSAASLIAAAAAAWRMPDLHPACLSS